jgi:carboxymethylenebutenolidase
MIFGATPQEDPMAKTVTLDTPDGEMGLYDAEPDAQADSAVIVLQEAFGVNDHIEDVTRRFAAEGFRSVSPHLFHRTGSPVLGYTDFEKVMPNMQALTREGLTTDLEATLEHLRSLGFGDSSIGVVGFCMGGSVAFLAASTFSLGAAVTFYGGGVAEGRFGMPPLIDLAKDLKTPWLGLFGDMDQGIPVEQVELLRAAVTDAPVPAEIVRYAEANHGFHCDRRDSYHEGSAVDAWRRTIDWFGEHLGKG